jgi:hypothetical protein
VLLPVLFFLAVVCSAQDLPSAARELARKINRQDVTSLTVRNSSSLPDTEAAEVARTLEAELHGRPRPEGSTVHVTLSENVREYLWVAEIQHGEERDVVMLSVARPSTPASPLAPVAIEKRLLWEQEKPILDAILAGSLLIVLDPSSVSFYRGRQLTSSLPVSIPSPASRDPRGWLSVDRDSFQAFLPGVVCSGRLAADSAMSCAESNSAAIVVGRNYFSEPRLPPYFSSVVLPGMRIVAGVDGRARVYDGGLRELATITGWGSDLAAIESPCHAGPRILASKPGEAGEPDAVQAYEMTGGRAVVAGDPVTFLGPVTALWGRQAEAVAVARNSDTGRYAAYSLAITCGR